MLARLLIHISKPLETAGRKAMGANVLLYYASPAAGYFASDIFGKERMDFMKQIKRLRRRGFALFLALAVCMSTLQITAFADDGSGNAGVESSESGNESYTSNDDTSSSDADSDAGSSDTSSDAGGSDTSSDAGSSDNSSTDFGTDSGSSSDAGSGTTDGTDSGTDSNDTTDTSDGTGSDVDSGTDAGDNADSDTKTEVITNDPQDISPEEGAGRIPEDATVKNDSTTTTNPENGDSTTTTTTDKEWSNTTTENGEYGDVTSGGKTEEVDKLTGSDAASNLDSIEDGTYTKTDTQDKTDVETVVTGGEHRTDNETVDANGNKIGDSFEMSGQETTTTTETTTTKTETTEVKKETDEEKTSIIHFK